MDRDRSRSRERVLPTRTGGDRIADLEIQLTDMQHLHQLMEICDQLMDRVLTLERFVEVLQHFSLQHSERVRTLEAILGVPSPPVGPPPATPVRSSAATVEGTRSGSADLESSPYAPGVRQPIGSPHAPGVRDIRGSAATPKPAPATPRAPDPPDFSWRPFRRRNQQSSSGSGRVDPRDT